MRLGEITGLVKYCLRRFLADYREYKARRKAWPNSSVHEGAIIVGDKNNIQIGHDSYINHAAFINVGMKAYGKKGSLHIGNHVIVGNKSVLFAGISSIEIGDYTDIGTGALILAHSRASDYDPERKEGKQFEAAPIKIGKCCNIASGAIVLSGTVLEDYCIVGAGAIVQGHYKKGTSLIGNAARPIPRKLK